MSEDNNNPLENRLGSDPWKIMQIQFKSNNVIEFEHGEPHTLEQSYYLGAILSADRTIVYWVNDTKPLP